MIFLTVKQVWNLPAANSISFLVDDKPVNSEYNGDVSNVAILTDNLQFIYYQDKYYRVSMADLEDDDVRAWIDDPFAGFPDYDPIPEYTPSWPDNSS